jgi:hypothetical protein
MSMKHGLEVRFHWQDYDVLQIEVSASNELFCGSALPYVSRGVLNDAASALDGFPTGPSDARELELGGKGMGFAGGFVHLRFSCRDLAAHSIVEIVIESKNEGRLGSSQAGEPETVRFFANVEANAIDDFVRDLRRLHDAESGSAWLSFLK